MSWLTSATDKEPEQRAQEDYQNYRNGNLSESFESFDENPEEDGFSVGRYMNEFARQFMEKFI